MVRTVLVPLLAAMLLGAPLSARADDGEHDGDNDHDFARDLYEHGEILSLHEILGALRHQVTGDVVAVELVQVAGTWIYRFQVVAPDGRRQTVDVPAAPPGSPNRGHE